MEPVTHLLTGACLSRAGLNRLTAYATVAMVLAAEAPDLDIVWALGGPVAAFQHHRGITHTLVGAPFVALVVTLVLWLFHRWRKKKPEQAVNWLLVWLLSFIAVLSHLLLDFTNSYGLRPFFPFNPRWYSWDIVFIFEPVMFAILLVALSVPALLGLADREIGVRKTQFRGRGWAIFALTSIVLLYAWRNAEHERALNLVKSGALTEAKLLKIGVEPYAINPFRWYVVAETPDFFQTATVNTRTGTVDTDPSGSVLYKPPTTMATLAAKRSWLGEVYLDWAQFPVVEDRGTQAAPGTQSGPREPQGSAGQASAVEFRDLRFNYSTLMLDGTKAPLSGWVYVGSDRQIQAQVMSGREQH